MDAQNWEIPAVKLDVSAKDDAHARATVTLTDRGKPHVIKLKLTKTKAGMRIHNMRWSWSKPKQSLLQILSSPMP